MTFVSLTRLKLRSSRFFPLFALHAFGSVQQVKKAQGFRTGAVLPERSLAFWTMTGWDSPEAMRHFMTSGAHKKAMPHLLDWCDEASVAEWTQTTDTLPSWIEADRRMRESGRPSKVFHPSPRHASLTHQPPGSTKAEYRFSAPR